MSICADTRTRSHVAGLGNAVAGIVVAGARKFSKRTKTRRDAVMLAGLDDHMLSDIGLTRGDVRDAFSEPVWRDPTAILVSPAQERRVNRRRAVLGLSEKVFEAPSIVPAQKERTCQAPVQVRHY